MGKKNKDLEKSSSTNQIKQSTNIIFNIIFLLLGLTCIFPLLFVFSISITSEEALRSGGYQIIPPEFSTAAYQFLWNERTMIFRAVFMSIIVTVIGTIITIALTTTMGYVVSRRGFKLKGIYTWIIFVPMIFNGGMIPTYLVMKQLKLLNTLGSVILPLGINVYNLVLMRNFFEGIPGSLFEAAQIDGCSPMGIFFKIVLPLSKAAIASIGLMFMVTFWNDYTNFKIYINNNMLFNFQIKLRSLVMDNDMPDVDGVDPNTVKNAATIVAILPFMIMYPFLQDYFVQGVNVGAVKE